MQVGGEGQREGGREGQGDVHVHTCMPPQCTLHSALL